MIYALYTVSGATYKDLRNEAQSDAAMAGFDPATHNLCVMYCTPLKLEPGGRVELWHGWAVIFTGDIHTQQELLSKLLVIESQKRRSSPSESQQQSLPPTQ